MLVFLGGGGGWRMEGEYEIIIVKGRNGTESSELAASLRNDPIIIFYRTRGCCEGDFANGEFIRGCDVVAVRIAWL